jgi:transposase
MGPDFIRNREELEHLIVTQHRDGLGIRALTRRFAMGRNTIRRILRKHRGRRDDGHDMVLQARKSHPCRSKLDPYVPVMKDFLERFPDVTGIRMLEELQDAGYDGGVTILRERLRTLRPRPKRAPEVRFETEPGHQGQMDWSPYTIPFAQGGKTKVLCFSYVLGFSRRHYIDFTLKRDFFTLIRRHQDAFQYFDGVPLTCLYDGEKTVILRWEAGRPVFNPRFTAFITHYCCKPVGCRPGRPETKGKIEAPFQYVENNLLNARNFDNLEDLRGTARWWLKEKSDTHKHDTTGRPPLELFMEQEYSALQPLPIHPYDSSEVALRVCRMDGFLEHDTNLYSVPYEYVGDILTLKATEHEVIVYSPDLDIIAHHERLPVGACRHNENPDHRKTMKIRYGLEPVREAFLRLGDGVEEFLEGLKERYPRNCGYHVRLILYLKERYHSDEIHKACVHASRYQAFDAKAVERIVTARARPRTLESIRNERAREILAATLPAIKQRPLNEYCHLLTRETRDEQQEGYSNQNPESSEDTQASHHGKDPG